MRVKRVDEMASTMFKKLPDFEMHWSSTRLLLESVAIGVIYIISSLELFGHSFPEATETLFIQSHIAILVTELSHFPVNRRSSDNVYMMTTEMLNRMIVITFICLLTDAMFLVRMGDFSRSGSDEFIVKIVFGCIAVFCDVIRSFVVLYKSMNVTASGFIATKGNRDKN